MFEFRRRGQPKVATLAPLPSYEAMERRIEEAPEEFEKIELPAQTELGSAAKHVETKSADFWIVRFKDETKIEVLSRESDQNEDPNELIAKGQAHWVTLPKHITLAGIERKYGSSIRRAGIWRRRRKLTLIVWTLLDEDEFTARVLISVPK